MSHLSLGTVRLPCAALCGRSSALLMLSTNWWGSPDRFTVDGLRADLDALRMALLVVGDEELFYFNAHPASPLPEALESRALRALRQSGSGARRRAAGVTLSLLEPDGRERFALSRKLRGGVADAVREALQIARQSVDLPASFRTFSERELLFYSLVGALNLVLTDVAAQERVTHTAQA
jgi:hypothetical protein